MPSDSHDSNGAAPPRREDKLRLREISLVVHPASSRIIMRRHARDDERVLEEEDVTSMVIGLAAASMTAVALREKMPGAAIPFEGEEGVEWVMSVQRTREVVVSAADTGPYALPEPLPGEVPVEKSRVIRPPGHIESEGEP